MLHRSKDKNLTKKEEELEKKDAKQTKRGKKKDEKKEKKPWGKFERYIVFFTLLVTIVISGILAIAARSWKLPNIPRINLPESAFEETFVIENKKTNNGHQNIEKEFTNKTQSLSGVYGFSILNLVDDAEYGLFENESFQAASLIKLPLMSYVYELAEDDRLNLESIYTLTEDDKVGGSGSLQYAEIGTAKTFRELVELMGQQSDNTAYNILVNKVGEDKLQNYIEEIGMAHTDVETNQTTISDITLYFKKLWQRRLINEENRDELLSFLTDTIYEEYLPARLPEDIDIAHKYGRELHVINDAGIVFTGRPFVMVIMTKGVVEKEADQVFAELASLLYDYETSR